MLNASGGGRKFAASNRQDHQVRSGIRRDKAARLDSIESETPIEGGIAEHEDSLPPGGFAPRDSLPDQPAANTCPPILMQDRDRAERQRRKWRFHP
jgi:hypothetical protein